tara:strand:- start:1460 stop:1741 length:282 start_codon:yes stop_codon:yes gene_type:complete
MTVEEASQNNEEYQKFNAQLRESIETLLIKADIAFAMYDILSQIDFGAHGGELKMCWGDKLKYDDLPWGDWETALERTVSFDAYIDMDKTEDN